MRKTSAGINVTTQISEQLKRDRKMLSKGGNPPCLREGRNSGFCRNFQLPVSYSLYNHWKNKNSES